MASKFELVEQIEAELGAPTARLWEASKPTLERILTALKRPRYPLATTLLERAQYAMAGWRNAVKDEDGGFDADDLAHLLAGMRIWAQDAGLNFHACVKRSEEYHRNAWGIPSWGRPITPLRGGELGGPHSARRR